MRFAVRRVFIYRNCNFITNFSFRFKNKSHVMNHLNNVHLKIKRYQCNICGFAMYSKTHHTIHMKAHSNVREFKCTQCGKDFSRKESLLVHQRYDESIVNERLIFIQFIYRTHTNERPYKCKFCDRSYTAHTDLKRHMFTHVSNRWMCPHFIIKNFLLHSDACSSLHLPALQRRILPKTSSLWARQHRSFWNRHNILANRKNISQFLINLNFAIYLNKTENILW